MGARPGVLEVVFTLGRAIREWRSALRTLDDQLRNAEAVEHRARSAVSESQSRVVAAQRALTDASMQRTRVQEFLVGLRRQLGADKEAFGPAYPDRDWAGEARELRAPWLDADLDAARSDLFLAALQLHQDFIANTAADMTHGLRAALEVFTGDCPRRLEAEKRRAAWQLFFLVVPVVSTTFASVGSMFGDIGAESIGWVLIDEAGQVAPQYAAGAIWRARRAVVVGDPLQLQPVVTIPHKAQRDMATAYGASATWMPPQASVQTLADRVARLGTTMQQGGEPIWVSAQLTVHRRCADPMFTFCNQIAYSGIMVHGVKDRPDPFDGTAGAHVVPSKWLDEPARTPGSHLQENQVERLERVLEDLHERGIPPSEVIAISPFRAVATRLAELSRRYPGLQAGTIHTAQGREASVVFLVLGGDPSSPGAKAWASSTVNLVNVAASRARHRLYVIGDRAAWMGHNYFRQLAALLTS